ncbi:MAG: aminoacyl-tRNA deacylase [Noviherbaspirillum sp.]
MSIPNKIEDSLRGSQYQVLQHPHTSTSSQTAETAHVPGDCLAKTVILGDRQGYVAAVIPSTYQLRLSELREQTGRQLELAREEDLGKLFTDCEVGAVPPLGAAYGVQTYLDESLAQKPEIYFEAGNHEALIRMSTDQFLDLMEQAEKGRFAYRM